MVFSYLQVFIPIICLIINVLIQIISFRYFLRPQLLKTIFLGFIIGMLSAFIFQLYILFGSTMHRDGFIAIFITNLIIYIALSYCYFHFINLGETARRIRILRELYDSKVGLSPEEILKRYNAKEIIERRIERLINNGQIVYRDGKYYIGNPVMLSFARVIEGMKLILLGKRIGFN